MKKFIGISLFLLMLVGGIASWQYGKFHDGRLHVIFCNVGQGMAIFIRTPEAHDVLYDAGPGSAVLGCLSRHMPFWDHAIDLALLSHPHLDHYEGYFALLDRYTIASFATQRIGEPQDEYAGLLDAVKNHHIPFQQLFAGDHYTIEKNIQLHIIAPRREDADILSAGTDLNERSMMFTLQDGALNILFTGDSPAETVKLALPAVRMPINILQVPHHGSKYGLDDEIVGHLQPKLAVISVGKNNYGHPAPLTLDLLKKYHIPFLRTDKHGDVEIVSDGVKWWLIE